MKTRSDFHQRMKAAREDAGMTLIDVVFELRQRMPEPLWVSQSKLGRMETDTPEEKADPFLLNVLASIYGVRTSELSPKAGDSLEQLRGLLEHASPCITARDESQLTLELVGAR